MASAAKPMVGQIKEALKAGGTKGVAQGGKLKQKSKPPAGVLPADLVKAQTDAATTAAQVGATYQQQQQHT